MTLLGCDTINLDDTGLLVLDTKTGGTSAKGHIWVFVGRKYDPGGDLSKTQEYVFYMYAPTWAAKYPEAFLTGCTASLLGDAYRGYGRIVSPYRGDMLEKLLAGCCMHARRPFHQARTLKDPSADFFLDGFKRIYAVEDQAREQSLRVDQRLELRQQVSLPIMEAMKSRAVALADVPLIKPMKQGVTYFLNQWERLIVPFTKDGRLDIDNGSAERRLRPVASGRKSWLFAGSAGGAARFADMLSLVSSAEAAGVDPGAYISSLITMVSTWPHRRLVDLLPQSWKTLGQAQQ